LIGKKSPKKYAKLFVGNLTVDEAATYLTELKSFSDKIKSSRQLYLFFKSPLFSQKEREEMLSAIASQGELSHRVHAFILFLSNRDSISLLDKIIKAIADLIDERARKLKAQVVSAEPLKEMYLSQIKQILEDSLQIEIIIETQLDSSLIGGFKVKAGSLVYDGSIKNQLTMLKDVLLKT